MGVQDVVRADKTADSASFHESLLTDLRALEQMLDADLPEPPRRDVVATDME